MPTTWPKRRVFRDQATERGGFASNGLKTERANPSHPSQRPSCSLELFQDRGRRAEGFSFPSIGLRAGGHLARTSHSQGTVHGASLHQYRGRAGLGSGRVDEKGALQSCRVVHSVPCPPSYRKGDWSHRRRSQAGLDDRGQEKGR